MNFDLNDMLTIQYENQEEKQLLNLSKYIDDLLIEMEDFNMHNYDNFYGDLIKKIRAFISNYVLEKQNSICSPIQQFLFFLARLYHKLSKISFMNKQFLINFLIKRIFLFHDFLYSQDYNDIMIINDKIIMCYHNNDIIPIVEHCIYLIVNTFIYKDKNEMKEIDYFRNFFDEYSDISEIKMKILEIFFIQLICIDNFAGDKYKDMLKEPKKVKEFIQNKIGEFYELSEENINYNNNDNNDEANILSLFKSGIEKAEGYLLRYLFYAIIAVFTPLDPSILDFFESIINKYIENKGSENCESESEKKINLDELGNLFLKYNIKDVNIKIRNLSFLIDAIIQKYYNIQDIPELDMLKFPRLNILINRIFIGKPKFKEDSSKEVINAIFEHFIVSQFLVNYIKYQVTDIEHYPIEIRYFVIFSYIKISKNYIISNPFSAYIASLTFREIINYLKLEKGFEVQKDKIDKPLKLLSKTLFNYLCFIYSMENKYKNFSEYFWNLYFFIDDYIEKNVDTISLDEDWTWIYIHSTKFIKNFGLNKTFEKFKINQEKTSFEQNVNLIRFLSKKVKYCNTQEQFLILDVIYHILININDLQTILKTPKYSQTFQKLNRALSYLSLNINYLMNFSKNMSVNEQDLVKDIGDKLFKITNLLFIESLDEYFWMPKTLRGYRSFNEFIAILEIEFDKKLFKKSLYSEQFLHGLVALKSYTYKFVSNKNKINLKQYIYSLDYFCKFEIPSLNSMVKESIFSLMKLMSDEYDLTDVNDKVDLIKKILISGEYDLRVCFFLICQLITNKKFEQKSSELKLIKEIFNFMTKEKFKLMTNFLLTLYKSIEKYSYDLIHKYYQLNFPNNYNFSKEKYQKFLDLFNPKNPIEQNNQLGKDIQIITNNWNLIKEELEKGGEFYNFLANAEELNYPKTVMNIIEKYIFDINRKYNIHSFTKNNNQIEYNDKFFRKYLQLYYKAYSRIDDNKIILDNYFSNNEILSLLHNYNRSFYNNNICSVDNCYITISDIINKFNEFLINLDVSILSDTMSLIETNQSKNDNYIYLRIIRILCDIYLLNEKKMDVEQRKLKFLSIKTIEKNTILEILSHNNKLNESYNLKTYSLWFYELALYLEEFEKFCYQCPTNSEFIKNIDLLSKQLKNIFINKRKLPHLKRYLLLFQFRRFIFNLYKDKVSEFYCLMDICKVYKSIYETGISKEELYSFRKILIIYCNNLLDTDNNILINIDSKLILVPLKYYVKFFAGDRDIPFDKAYNKYINLYTYIKKGQSLSNKILILNDKLKVKTKVVGIDEILINKIKKLKNKTSPNNLEGLLLYTDLYLEQLLNNETAFKYIKSCELINEIQLCNINDIIYNYLEGAITICEISDKDKYLRKYMPEIINV